ncbi:MAG: hypothetical protein WCD89_01005 [Anaerocolumna sp.]
MKFKKQLLFILGKLISGVKFFLNKRQLLNFNMKDKYTPHKMAVFAVVLIGLIWAYALFIPPYLGVADDGTFYKAMEKAGLSYTQEDSADRYNNYYVRVYSHNSSVSSDTKNAQDVFIGTAVFLDDLITKDKVFDIRFLAVLYGILFLPAVYIIVKQACIRVSNFSEAFTLTLFGVLIFGDITYLTYFASLYPEALWYICLLYTAGLTGTLQGKYSSLKLFILMFSGIAFSLSRQQCWVIGILLAGFFIRSTFFNKMLLWKLYCILLALVLSISGIVSFYRLESDFTITSKYHAMTRGVLFQADNPEKALEEFGIDSSFSILANTSAYDYYPEVLPDDKALQKGFYDKYSSYDIALYYIKHPGSFIGMMDIAVKSVTNLRRSFCGNYEKTAGMPVMAKSLFWSGWSNFKERSMPKTIGYFILLLVIAFLFYGRGIRPKFSKRKQKDSKLMLELVVIVAGIGISQAVITVIMSGDVLLTQHGFLLGAAMDIILYFVVADLLSRLGILEEREGK